MVMCWFMSLSLCFVAVLNSIKFVGSCLLCFLCVPCMYVLMFCSFSFSVSVAVIWLILFCSFSCVCLTLFIQSQVVSVVSFVLCM